MVDKQGHQGTPKQGAPLCSCSPCRRVRSNSSRPQAERRGAGVVGTHKRGQRPHMDSHGPAHHAASALVGAMANVH